MVGESVWHTSCERGGVASAFSLRRRVSMMPTNHTALGCRILLWAFGCCCKRQMLPRNGRPISDFRNRDRAWFEVAKDLQSILENIANPRSSLEAATIANPRSSLEAATRSGSPVKSLRSPDREELLDALLSLLPSQFEELLFRLNINRAHLSGDAGNFALRHLHHRQRANTFPFVAVFAANYGAEYLLPVGL